MNTAKPLRTLLAVALWTGVVAAVTGCAPKATSFDTGIATERTALRVRNDSWQDVRVYLASSFGAAPVRVATVTAASSAVIQLRGRVLQEIRNRGSIQFLIRPLGSRVSYTTQSVPVRAGDEIKLNVANHLTFSTLYIGGRR